MNPGRPVSNEHSRSEMAEFQSHSQQPTLPSSLSFNQAMHGGQGMRRSPTSPRQFSEMP